MCYNGELMESADCVIIGAGIIGLATAYALLQQQPNLRIAILEKEERIAQHQSGRNSGVIHSGIYYPPESEKAYHCRRGKGLVRQFCQEEKIPYETCGKVIVAINGEELPYLEVLYKRGIANGVDCQLITPHQLRELEPFAEGVAAIYVPETGIVSFHQVAERLALRVRAAGGRFWLDTKVRALRESADGVIVQTNHGAFFGRVVLNAAGVYADRLAHQVQAATDITIVPFRGEYYQLRPQYTYLVRNLIYPVPDPGLPFLGVHFSRTLLNTVECGPNAVLAGSREGYYKGKINPRDTWKQLTDPAIIQLTRQHFHTAVWELRRSWSKSLFTQTLQRLVPSLREEMLVPSISGVRAQAVNAQGQLLQDFIFAESLQMWHVVSAPSPGATSALSIGRTLAEKLQAKLR